MHSDNRALTLAVGPFCLLKPGEDKKVTLFLNSYKIFLLPQFDRDQLSYIKYPELCMGIDSDISQRYTRMAKTQLGNRD